MIITKKQLIQEGILDAVKNNWGKGLLAIGGLAAADAGVFGDKAQKAVEAGGAQTKQFLKDAGDWSKTAIDKMNIKYGKDINGDGKPSMTEAAKAAKDSVNLSDSLGSLNNTTKDAIDNTVEKIKSLTGEHGDN